jgi:hypothetical protein
MFSSLTDLAVRIGSKVVNVLTVETEIGANCPF